MAVLSVGDAGAEVFGYDEAVDSPFTLVGEGNIGDVFAIQAGNQVRPEAIGGGGVGDVSRQGTTIDNRLTRWHGSNAFIQNSAVVVNDSGDLSGVNDFLLIGIITAGSDPIILTTVTGLLRHQAIDPSIAGSGLSVAGGVLSVDSHVPAAHSISFHSDTGATGAELETLTNGNNADSLHSHSVGGAPTDWASPGTIGSSAPNTGAFTTLDTSGNLSVTGTSSVVNATGSALFVLDRPDVTPTDNQIIGEFRFTSLNDAAQNGNMGGIKMVFTDVSSISERTTLEFYTNFNTPNKRMTLNAEGDLELISGKLTVRSGTITAGVAASQVGVVSLKRGSGGNQPAYMALVSRNGTVWTVFVEDDGTLKIYGKVPADNADGTVVGTQT